MTFTDKCQTWNFSNFREKEVLNSGNGFLQDVAREMQPRIVPKSTPRPNRQLSYVSLFYLGPSVCFLGGGRDMEPEGAIYEDQYLISLSICREERKKKQRESRRKMGEKGFESRPRKDQRWPHASMFPKIPLYKKFHFTCFRKGIQKSKVISHCDIIAPSALSVRG